MVQDFAYAVRVTHRHVIVLKVCGDPGRVGVCAPPDQERTGTEEAQGNDPECNDASGHRARCVRRDQVCGMTALRECMNACYGNKEGCTTRAAHGEVEG